MKDGQQALAALRSEHFNLVIPRPWIAQNRWSGSAPSASRGHGGLEQNQHVPVLILTARDEIQDRVKGLDYGADDYLVKPFDISELMARMRALTRRAKGRTVDSMYRGHIGDLPFRAQGHARWQPVTPVATGNMPSSLPWPKSRIRSFTKTTVGTDPLWMG